MNQRTDNRIGFLGTYFNRDSALQLARWAGILAWALLAMYTYTTLVSTGQYLSLLLSGSISYEGTSIFDRLSIPTLQISQLVPGLVYFVMLKIAQQMLLILLDVEDNSRRAARK
jgi:energy-coupling factor transporter transmembrane protein EcfT